MPRTKDRRTIRSKRSASSAAASVSPDARRYHLFRSGVSPEEQAARENIRLATITASIERQQLLSQQFSLDSMQQAAREMLMDQFPNMASALREASEAVQELKKEELQEDGQMTTTSYFVPDHSTRLKAIKAFESLLSCIQPKTPMVAVDARSQTQINNPAPAAGSGGPLSTESIIRQIRAERGLALPSETGTVETVPSVMPGNAAAPEFVEKDIELEAELAEEGELVEPE
jgi:hypothetical protein